MRLTNHGRWLVLQYLEELKNRRDEILKLKLDTAYDTTLPTLEDILDDIDFIGFDDLGEYYNGWAVTDHYDADYPLLLKRGRDVEC